MINKTSAELSEVIMKLCWNQNCSMLFQLEEAAQHMASFISAEFTIRDSARHL